MKAASRHHAPTTQRSAGRIVRARHLARAVLLVGKRHTSVSTDERAIPGSHVVKQKGGSRKTRGSG